MEPIQILELIKEDIRDKFDGDPLMMRTMNLVITEYKARSERLHKLGVSGKRPEWLDDETIHEAEQLWFTPNVNGSNPRAQAIRLIQSVAQKSGYEISIKKAYEIVQAAGVCGALDKTT